MFQLAEIKEEEVENIYTMAKRSEVDNRKKEFQYKILNRILAVNVYLKKIGIKNSDACQFCQVESETIQHLLYDWQITQVFWQSFRNWWKTSTKKEITLSAQDVILGYDFKECPKTINYFILTAKYFIYKSKVKDNKPLFENFISVLRKEYYSDQERYKAYGNKKILCKWSEINF